MEQIVYAIKNKNNLYATMEDCEAEKLERSDTYENS